MCELRDQINQINTEYQEDLTYTKEYFEDRMKDLVKACSRQASKEVLDRQASKEVLPLDQSVSSR